MSGDRLEPADVFVFLEACFSKNEHYASYFELLLDHYKQSGQKTNKGYVLEVSDLKNESKVFHQFLKWAVKHRILYLVNYQNKQYLLMSFDVYDYLIDVLEDSDEVSDTFTYESSDDDLDRSLTHSIGFRVFLSSIVLFVFFMSFLILSFYFSSFMISFVVIFLGILSLGLFIYNLIMYKSKTHRASHQHFLLYIIGMVCFFFMFYITGFIEFTTGHFKHSVNETVTSKNMNEALLIKDFVFDFDTFSVTELDNEELSSSLSIAITNISEKDYNITLGLQAYDKDHNKLGDVNVISDISIASDDTVMVDAYKNIDNDLVDKLLEDGVYYKIDFIKEAS